MKRFLLAVDNLRVSVVGKIVLDKLHLRVGYGETIVLMGSNGSGKSSLVQALMGNPNYVLDSGKVEFEGKDLLKMTSDERARAGLYVAWQNPVTIPGVTVFSLCKSAYESLRQDQPSEYKSLVELRKELERIALRVGLKKEHIGRSVNEGFSGGERKRLELLQLMLIKPKLAILDEIDSGLDAKGVKTVLAIIEEMRRMGTSFILITHNKRLLEEVVSDQIWEMKHGRLSTGV